MHIWPITTFMFLSCIKKLLPYLKTENTSAIHIVEKNSDVHFPRQANWFIIHKHLTSYITQYKGIERYRKA